MSIQFNTGSGIDGTSRKYELFVYITTNKYKQIEKEGWQRLMTVLFIG